MSVDRPLWLFDESRYVGVDYTDGDVVNDYDRQHGSFRDHDEEVRKIAQALGLSELSTVLDIGCGTGELSIRLARLCGHVYAVDASEAMVAKLRNKASESGLENVSSAQSGLLTYEHDGDPLDAVIVNVVLHHLPDFWKQIALCRLYDMLKKGGKLFLTDVVFGFDPRRHQEAIEAWLSGMRQLAGEKLAEETVVHIRDEFSRWEWVMRGLLERAGFEAIGEFEIMPNMRAYVCSK